MQSASGPIRKVGGLQSVSGPIQKVCVWGGGGGGKYVIVNN